LWRETFSDAGILDVLNILTGNISFLALKRGRFKAHLHAFGNDRGDTADGNPVLGIRG
jgi:hypothetical protein